MCQTNTLFDWTCSDKINTVFPRKEAPGASYFLLWPFRWGNWKIRTWTMDADYGRGHGSIIHPIIINYYCLIQTVYTVLNINNSNKKMVGYEYTEQTQ